MAVVLADGYVWNPLVELRRESFKYRIRPDRSLRTGYITKSCDEYLTLGQYLSYRPVASVGKQILSNGEKLSIEETVENRERWGNIAVTVDAFSGQLSYISFIIYVKNIHVSAFPSNNSHRTQKLDFSYLALSNNCSVISLTTGWSILCKTKETMCTIFENCCKRHKIARYFIEILLLNSKHAICGKILRRDLMNPSLQNMKMLLQRSTIVERMLTWINKISLMI